MLVNLIKRSSTVDRKHKRLILLAHDSLAMVCALWAALSVRLGLAYVPADPPLIIPAVVSIIAGLAALSKLRVYRIVLRFFDISSVSRILFGAIVAALTWALLVYFSRASMIVGGVEILTPRSVGVIYCCFLFTFLFIGRYAMAALIVGVSRAGSLRGEGLSRNVAIYGANAAGIALVESVQRNPRLSLSALVDDDPALAGQIVAGTEIQHSSELPDLVRDEGIQEVFLALPQATRSQRLGAITRLKQLNVAVKTVPAPEEIVSGRFTVSDVRPVDVNDLLRREPVQPISELIEEAVKGRSIIITGAGGSIGSEICRQLIRSSPKKLVLLDHSEFALYSIEQQLAELVGAYGASERPVIVPVVGSMLNELLVRDLISTEAVDTVYHAAAYKHVPLLEHNEVVGVENNVLGTWILARAAFDAKIKRFTMISTDKAVRPKSVMGASKRMAELIIQALAGVGETRFGIVRFGNVLDSSGSVVQRFRKQIEGGGPLTVTHPEITRFFMSIPEATQLVLQASAMAHRGEVFVLDMGEPVRISELARNLISLSGMTIRDEENPTGDIEIHYVGLRPGEKLFEELFVGEETLPTLHPRISMASERCVSWEEIRTHVEQLRAAIFAGDPVAVRRKLQEVVLPDVGRLQLGSDRPSRVPRNPRVII